MPSATRVGWLSGDRRYPAEPRFSKLSAIGLAEAVRGRWGIENSLHWVLDLIFKEDQSRLRAGHGARNMAVVRHFAINAVRLGKGKRSIKTTRKLAGWNPDDAAAQAAREGRVHALWSCLACR